MAKKLSKILWYGADKDASGKPIIPPLSPSIEKHLEGLNEGEIYIHNDDEYPALYIRTNKDKIVAIGGAEALMKYFLRKDQPDTAREVITFEKGLNVGEFVSGASGASFFKDLTTGQTIMELDKLYVRMKAFFETLTIVEAQTISGKQIISPAGSVRCTNVEEYDDYYRCYFLNEQDGEKIENKFIVGDQVYSQMFNAKTGTTNKISNRYYWRLVTGVGENYIDLSKTDFDADSDAPMVGDILNQRGHRYPENSERMNFIETSTVDGFSPSITLFHGVNSFSLAGKDYVQFGVDKTTNKAFMNVYGDMYVGDRNKTAYMRYTQEEGLVICGKLEVGTKLGDKDLQELIDSATPEGYQEFVEKVTQDLAGLQSQIDGTIDSYFFQYEPSLDNYPASEWDTENEKKAHLNDTFTNLVDGRSWRWSLDGTYKWVEITDTATTKALALAGKAQDTADGKRRVFVVTDEHPTPYPPYDKGDLWSRGSDYPLLICVVPKESGVYAEGDFDYADNNAKLKEEMQTLVADTKDELNNSIGQAKEAANKYADEGIASAKEDINASIAELEEAKANVTEVYSKAEADGKITEAETSAINAAKAQADAAIALSETTIKAYADGIVDDEEAARIKQAQENLAEAKKYAEEQAQAAKSEIENSYLFQALQDAQSTEIENGLVLTSLIQLRDTQSNIMSGINGLINASKGDKSIATWWGGGMYDLIDYYRWDGTQWVVKSGLTAPSNIPSGLIRMDGTGYLAKGKFWWDDDGKIYADPTALFLSFDVENEGASLSATILDIRDKQTEFANMWSLETDSNGTQYLYSKYPLVSQGGVTMYAGTSGLDVEGIYDGLPIDGSTIYWENGVLKAQGGGVADSVAWADITGKPSFATVATSGSYNDLLNKPTLLSSFTNDLGFVTESALSGNYVPLAGDVTMTGPLRIATSATVFTVLKTNGGTSYINFKSVIDGTSRDLGDLGVDVNKNLVYFSGGWKNVIHSGNYTSYTYSQSSIDSKLSGYLPLSGGTLESTSVPLTINRIGQIAVGICYSIDGSEIGSIGFHKNTGLAYYDAANLGWYKIWNEINFNPSNYLPLTGGTLKGVLGINASASPSIIQYYVGGNYYGALGFSAANNPIFRNTSGSNNTIYHTGNLTKLSQLTNDSGFITSSASISGNAATATKLATARTIWGQSFDGTGDVSGDLTGVGNIFGSGTIVIRSSNSGNIGLEYNGDVTKAVVLNSTQFKPYDAANGLLDLGYTSARWNGIYGNTLNLEYSNANLITLKRTASNSGAYIDYYANNQSSKYWRVGGNNIYGFSFTTNQGGGESTHVIISDSGNFGIGTTSPLTALHVERYATDVAFLTTIKNNASPNSSGHGVGLKLSLGGSSETGKWCGIAAIAESAYANQNGLALYSNAVERIRINGSGNVGIGTTSPEQKLHVYGMSKFESTSNIPVLVKSNNSVESSIAYYGKDNYRWVVGQGTANISNAFGIWSDTLNANAMTILSSGNVGIGTTSPSYKLHVEGAIYSSSYVKASTYFQVGGSTITDGTIELSGSTPFIDFHYGNSTADYTSRLIEGLSGQLTCTGKFRIGLNYTTSTDYNFYVNGSAYISSNLLTGGGITMYSAKVLKNVVDERGLSLKELSVIKPTRYTWKDKRDERLHIGGIADDIEQVLPEVVYRTPDGVLTMDYGNAAFAIASSLIKPMISHEERIARLERENRELKEEVKRLRA